MIVEGSGTALTLARVTPLASETVEVELVAAAASRFPLEAGNELAGVNDPANANTCPIIGLPSLFDGASVNVASEPITKDV